MSEAFHVSITREFSHVNFTGFFARLSFWFSCQFDPAQPLLLVAPSPKVLLSNGI